LPKRSEAPARVGELATKVLKKIKRSYERKELVTGVASGLIDLDRITGGFHPGNLIVIAGRRESGKTSLALTVALNAATNAHQQQVPVLLFTLEISAEDAALRMLCSQADCDLEIARSGYLRKTDRESLPHAVAQLQQAAILIDDDVSLSAACIGAKCEHVSQESTTTLGLVVVDYLQLLRPSDERPCGGGDILTAGELLKGLAEELRVPVVLFSELSENEQTKTRPPLLWDLGESGLLGHADVVMLMRRTSQPEVVEIEIVKHPLVLPDKTAVAIESKYGLIRNFVENS